MNDGMDELYRDIILDHYRNPRNSGSIEGDSVIIIEEFNPLCGDKIIVYLYSLSGELIDDIKFTGEGCSISQSSASIMTDLVIGKKIEHAKQIVQQFHTFITGGNIDEDDNSLGDIDAFKGVRKFPARIKCAGLAWNSLDKAIDSMKKLT
jgi:nitrogen fixation NifU-like protein